MYPFTFQEKFVNIKQLPFLLLLSLLILNACSPVTIAASSGQQPTPVQSFDQVPVAYQPIPVDHVGFQIGVTSPEAVEVVASGTWPDSCSQIAEVQTQRSDFKIDFTVLASTVGTCPAGQPGPPIRFVIPLNEAGLQNGTYTITVNGISNTFDWPPS